MPWSLSAPVAIFGRVIGCHPADVFPVAARRASGANILHLANAANRLRHVQRLSRTLYGSRRSDNDSLRCFSHGNVADRECRDGGDHQMSRVHGRAPLHRDDVRSACSRLVRADLGPAEINVNEKPFILMQGVKSDGLSRCPGSRVEKAAGLGPAASECDCRWPITRLRSNAPGLR